MDEQPFDHQMIVGRSMMTPKQRCVDRRLFISACHKLRFHNNFSQRLMEMCEELVFWLTGLQKRITITKSRPAEDGGTTFLVENVAIFEG